MFEYRSGSAAFREQMKEYFPEEADAIDRYIELVNEASRPAGEFLAVRAMPGAFADKAFDHVAPRFMPLAEKTTLEVLQSITRNEKLIAVLCGHFGDYASLPSVASFSVHASVIRHYLDGASYPIGGAQVIADQISETIRSAGGMVLAGGSSVTCPPNSGYLHVEGSMLSPDGHTRIDRDEERNRDQADDIPVGRPLFSGDASHPGDTSGQDVLCPLLALWSNFHFE